ncbi:hypothetical protein KsCSTR_01500 [Candidatus Kuenenia stuttgartiensis]|uniref:Uncharacterized protein n=1 Tax=Kuenenia stuttgartiensis TaxID=174633 RepID=Q1PV01_KUEST|nr:hypothetical protein KsCSTR_01500 [Candidatus Kuenenia stuttgartiensis]CAJ71052.1 unknown protein [Candidatus Kuenenia stuttgartiensis]
MDINYGCCLFPNKPCAGPAEASVWERAVYRLRGIVTIFSTYPF